MPWFLAIAGAFALLDWISVARDKSEIEAIAKPAVIVALIATVLSRGVTLETGLVAAALGCSLVGDVLLLPHFDRFVDGLKAFLVAHVFYLVAFIATGQTAWVMGVAVVATLGMVAIGRPIVAGSASEDERLGRAVVAYIIVLSIMVTVGIGTLVALVSLGAVVFAASDGVLGWDRFVAPVRRGRLITHVLYHVGQGLIVLGVPAN